MTIKQAHSRLKKVWEYMNLLAKLEQDDVPINSDDCHERLWRGGSSKGDSNNNRIASGGIGG
jgi:hypothetical protein